MAGFQRAGESSNMEQMQIQVGSRHKRLKGDNKRLRRANQIPAVIYGEGKLPVSVVVDGHDMELILKGAWNRHLIFNIAIDGSQEREPTIIRDIQRHPVSHKLVHIDFHRINLEHEIQMTVPVHVTGTDPIGVKAGGILEHTARAVNIRCKPLSMPKRLDADLSQLDIHQSFQVRDLQLPEGVELLDDQSMTLFSIVAPPVVAVPAAGEEEAAPEAAAEPELIGSKAEEEEEGE
jgi:large subunit ribosomal protein L25